MLVLLTLMFSKKPVGASSAYADVSGIIGRAVAPRHIAALKYFQENKPSLNWTLLFVASALVGIVGMILGSYLFALGSRFTDGTVGKWGRLGKLTLPGLVRIPPAVFIALFAPLLVGVLLLLEFVVEPLI